MASTSQQTSLRRILKRRRTMALAVYKQTRGGDSRLSQSLRSQEQSSPGRVYLVGAGPGDPELITLKGLRCLRAADVVVYDRLVSPQLLDEAPSHAEQVF